MKLSFLECPGPRRGTPCPRDPGPRHGGWYINGTSERLQTSNLAVVESLLSCGPGAAAHAWCSLEAENAVQIRFCGGCVRFSFALPSLRTPLTRQLRRFIHRYHGNGEGSPSPPAALMGLLEVKDPRRGEAQILGARGDRSQRSRAHRRGIRNTLMPGDTDHGRAATSCATARTAVCSAS